MSGLFVIFEASGAEIGFNVETSAPEADFNSDTYRALDVNAGHFEQLGASRAALLSLLEFFPFECEIRSRLLAALRAKALDPAPGGASPRDCALRLVQRSFDRLLIANGLIGLSDTK